MSRKGLGLEEEGDDLKPVKGWAIGNGPSPGSQGSELRSYVLQTFKAGGGTNSFQEGKEIT